MRSSSPTSSWLCSALATADSSSFAQSFAAARGVKARIARASRDVLAADVVADQARLARGRAHVLGVRADGDAGLDRARGRAGARAPASRRAGFAARRLRGRRGLAGASARRRPRRRGSAAGFASRRPSRGLGASSAASLGLVGGDLGRARLARALRLRRLGGVLGGGGLPRRRPRRLVGGLARFVGDLGVGLARVRGGLGLGGGLDGLLGGGGGARGLLVGALDLVVVACGCVSAHRTLPDFSWPR